MDPVSILVIVLTLYFAGMTAVANGDSACSARKANKQRMKNKTGDGSNGNTHLQDYGRIKPQDSHAVPHDFQQITTHPDPSGLQFVSLPRRKLGGWVVLEKEQQSPDTVQDTKIGIHTGKMPGYNLAMAEKHWSQFQNESINVSQGTIAVVNWLESLIAVYVYEPSWRTYYRNYHVVLLDTDLEAFAYHCYNHHVFSGIIEDTWFKFANSHVRRVYKHRWSRVKSTNSWSLLGIEGDIRGDPVFMEMKRGAVLGLIESRFRDPTFLNVDMVGHKIEQFVKVDTKFKDVDTKGNTVYFSVFGLSDNGWASESVLVG